MSADLHMLTGAYATDALDDLERARFEQHLDECAECRAEVRELTATAAVLAGAVAVQPPEQLRGRVLDEAARTRQLPPVVRDAAGRASWYRRPMTAAAAVMLIVAAGLGVLAGVAADRARDAERRADLIAAIATDPDRVVAEVPVADGGRSTVIAGHGAAILRTTPLDELPEGRVYQLWVIRSTGPESAGLLGRGGELEAVVEDMTGALGLGVTVEPAGGSDRPTGRTVFRVLMS